MPRPRHPSRLIWRLLVNARFRHSTTSPIWRWSRTAKHWLNPPIYFWWSTCSPTYRIGSVNSLRANGPIQWKISTSCHIFSNRSATCPPMRSIVFTSSLSSGVNRFVSCRTFSDENHVSWHWITIISMCIEDKPLTTVSLRRNRDVSHWALFRASMMISWINKQSPGTRNERCSRFELLNAIDGSRCPAWRSRL